jgi:hypothetical protein
MRLSPNRNNRYETEIQKTRAEWGGPLRGDTLQVRRACDAEKVRSRRKKALPTNGRAEDCRPGAGSLPAEQVGIITFGFQVKIAVSTLAQASVICPSEAVDHTPLLFGDVALVTQIGAAILLAGGCGPYDGFTCESGRRP